MGESTCIKLVEDSLGRRKEIFEGSSDWPARPIISIDQHRKSNGEWGKTQIQYSEDYPEYDAAGWREIVSLLQMAIEQAEEWDKEAAP